MPTTIQLPLQPGGMALRPALHGEQVLVESSNFVTSDDGSECIARLTLISGYFGEFFRLKKILPSQVDTFLAIIS
ncbi:MAG: hypothetical protein WBS19_12310, partial [Candidatus Korobacteraceae bacterium]